MVQNLNPIPKNYRWRIVALLFFATTINYIDRQVIGILKPFIADDLGWGEADYGYIVTAFQIAYAIGLLSTGRFLDKYGTRFRTPAFTGSKLRLYMRVPNQVFRSIGAQKQCKSALVRFCDPRAHDPGEKFRD